MSIHAHLSPEAEERIRAQKRSSTVSSILISLLVCVLIALVLFLVALPGFFIEPKTIVAYSAPADEDTEVEKKMVTNNIQRNPSAPSSAMAKVIASTAPSPTAIPVPEVNVPVPSAEFGSGDDFGDGWGTGGDGGGGGFAGIPSTMRKRCSKEDRLERLAQNGGTPACEDAVVNALRWLQKTQEKDGSWTGGNKGAMTGFALLAYLGHCETPLSEEFGETVLNAIVYLVELGNKNNGRLATSDAQSNHWVYEHGIATYALAEAYTFCSQLGLTIPDLDKVTRKAGDMIVNGQGQSGGWVYRYADTTGGDNSVGFWQIQALKACKHTGLWDEGELRKPARKALDWLESVQGSNGAIGYRNDSNRSPGLTGGGVLAFQMWGKGTGSEVRKGVDYIDKHTDFKWGEGEAGNLYYHYYNAQAMINFGGTKWTKYNKLFRDPLLKAQAKDGSWPMGGKIPHGSVNTHMKTCLATMMLEVYYRFLPATGAGI
jgi:hypothetical protein